MKILMLVNWKVKKCDEVPLNLQSSNYFIQSEPYWFFKDFVNVPEVDVIDISSNAFFETIERKIFHFYLIQGVKAIKRIRNYDLVISHGMPSAVIVAFWRKIFKKKYCDLKHIVFDIGCFNGAAENGVILKLMKFISKSIDGFIFHMSKQIYYYEKHFPRITRKSRFIPFGIDLSYFKGVEKTSINKNTILVIGKSKCDWLFATKVFNLIDIANLKLILIGGSEPKIVCNDSVYQLPIQPINKLKELINEALICFLPLEETKFSFGQMRLLQQMAMGKCIIASDISSLSDYGKHMENVIFYKPNDADDCIEKMKMAIENEKLRKQIENNAIENVRNNFTEKRMATEVEIFIKNIMDGNI